VSDYNDIKNIIEPLKERRLNKITQRIIGCAIEVHKNLGPGLLESIYANALCMELDEKRIEYEKEASIAATYKGRNIGEYRIDILVENEIIVELKATEKENDLHQAQLLSYLKLLNKNVGLLINFNKKFLKDGIKRIIL
jgi:GxxExxY protein